MADTNESHSSNPDIQLSVSESLETDAQWDIGMDLDGNLSDLYMFDELLLPYQTHLPLPERQEHSVEESAYNLPYDEMENVSTGTSLLEIPSRDSTNHFGEQMAIPVYGSFGPTFLAESSQNHETDADAVPRQAHRESFLNQDNAVNINKPKDQLSPLASKEAENILSKDLLLGSILPPAQPSIVTTLEGVAAVLTTYPSATQSSEGSSPFIHHQLLQPLKDDACGAFAIALCCASANAVRVSASEAFVYRFINSEREKVVENFVSSLKERIIFNFRQYTQSASYVSSLSSLHAMCIYQIIGFFNSNLQQARLASLQQPFLLKVASYFKIELTSQMARATYRSHLRQKTFKDREEQDWREWIRNETIRRAVFLVHMINHVSFSTQKQIPSYYEPLDDAMVLDLILPAAEELWKAGSAEEWISAKLQARQLNAVNQTARMIIEDATSITAHVKNLQQISQMIVYSLRNNDSYSEQT
jgi:hypothetical protein